jgi:hypothetical protein
MHSRTIPDEDILSEYEAVAQEAQTMAFLPRASELQEAAVKEIEGFMQKLAERKLEYVRNSDEKAANCVLAMEFALGAVRSELAMWIKLKGVSAEEAWSDLITAQELLGAALLVRRQLELDTTGIENLLRRLLFIEHWVFPPQMFNSIGGRAKCRECSICGAEYDDCDHVIGRAYMGKMCHTIIGEVSLAEVSVVTNPADKRCRITHFSDQGKMRNKMTWRLEEPRDVPDSLPKYGGR